VIDEKGLQVRAEFTQDAANSCDGESSTETPGKADENYDDLVTEERRDREDNEDRNGDKPPSRGPEQAESA
jgi:hypothetical protein